MNVTPHTVAKVSIPKPRIEWVASKMHITYEEVLSKLNELLQYVKDNTITEVKLWIDRFVPKRTGQLRTDLKEWIEGSILSNYVLRVTLGTYIPYAAALNEFNTAQVRHAGEVGYVYYPNKPGIRGRVILWDPEAIGNYFGKLVEYTKNVVMKYATMGSNIFFNKSETAKTEVIKSLG